MASESSTGPLEVVLRTHNFPQSGSWSMLDLAKLPVQHAVAMLSRYAAGRVNPYTILVGEALGLTFRMGHQGRINLENALTKIPSVSTFGNTLQIGLGIEDVTRIMARSEGGAMQLALCAALTECYSDDVAIEVLLEYARATQIVVEGQWMPSNMEWRNLLDACAGALAASNFAIRAEHYMQLATGEHRLAAFGSLEAMPDNHRGCSAPQSVANALVALAKLSTNRLESVTICGGPDAGWLAAVADWLLSLRLKIIDGTSGDLLFINHNERESTQVQIVYQTSAVPIAEPSRHTTSLKDPSRSENHAEDQSAPRKKLKLTMQSVQVRDRTYYIQLEDATQLLLEQNKEYNAHVVTGRVEWKKALRSAFLSDFDKLMKVSESLSAMIGSAARIFRAVAEADGGIPTTYLTTCTSYCDSAFGHGFIGNTIRWFPELGMLRDGMERAVTVSFKDAKKEYEKCISVLRNHCGCKTCQSSHTGFQAPDDIADPDASDSELADPDRSHASDSSSVDDWDSDHYCHVVIAETIISLCRALSNASLSCEDMSPVRSGFELAYGRQMNTRRSAHLGRQALKELGPIAFCMDFDNNFTIGLQEGNEDAAELRLFAVLELFTGRRVSSTNMATSAVWVNGITAFFGALKDMSCEDRNDVARTYVVPGRIQFEGKSYTRLTDWVFMHPIGGTENVADDYQQSLAIFETGDAYVNRRIMVKEGARDLQGLLDFYPEPDSQPKSSVLVGISALVVFLASRRGLVPCKNRSMRKCQPFHGMAWDKVQVNKNLRSGRYNSKEVIFMITTTSAHALATIASTVNQGTACLTFIVENECLDCCLRAVNAVNHPDRTRFCFIYLPGAKSGRDLWATS